MIPSDWYHKEKHPAEILQLHLSFLQRNATFCSMRIIHYIFTCITFFGRRAKREVHSLSSYKSFHWGGGGGGGLRLTIGPEP